MPFGLTETGFVTKPLATIKAELEADFRATFGVGVDLHPQSPNGQVIGIIAERIAEPWNQLEEIYASLSPGNASGTRLEMLASLTGTVRTEATKSLVTLTLLGTPGTIVVAGKVASKGGADRVATLEDATIGGGGTVDVEAEAEEAGPITFNASSIDTIETPVAGWTGVTNALDANPGEVRESDTALRLKRESELRAMGSAHLSAIAGRIRLVEDVTSVVGFENPTAVTVDGMPPHSVEMVVLGGDEDAILSTIFDAKAAGIETHGTESGTVTDEWGQDHTVKFSRSTDIDIYVEVDVVVDSTFPVDGATQIEEAIADYGDDFPLGRDVVASAIIPAVFSIPGVIDVSEVRIGTADPPTTDVTVEIAPRERARFDTTRIAVDVTEGSL